jgi:putative nucleotidyltransferase with HDIG domain
VIERLWFGDEDPELSQFEASRSMAAAMAVATGLKPFSVIAQQALALAYQPEPSLHKLCALIESDTALAGRVLRVANSALYRARGQIRDIHEASTRLGLLHLTDIITALVSMGLFADSTGIGARFRAHCTAVGAIARVVETEWNGRAVNHAFLCGLLHDIGKLLIMQAKEFDYRSLPFEQLNQADTLDSHERAETGFDHAVLGAHVVTQWGLPSDVAEVIAWHHQPGRAYEAGGAVAFGVAAVRVANALEYALWRDLDVDEAFIAALANAGDAAYLGLTETWFVAAWSKFVEALQVSAHSFD